MKALSSLGPLDNAAPLSTLSDVPNAPEKTVSHTAETAGSVSAREDLRENLVNTRKRLAAEAALRASNPAIRAAEEAQISKALRRYDGQANPMAKFERIIKPFAAMDKQTDLLKKVMDVSASAKMIGPAISSADLKMNLPQVPKDLLPNYSRTVFGKTAFDPIKLKNTSLAAHLQIEEPTRSHLRRTMLASSKAVLPGLPKAMLDKNFYDKYSAPFAAAAPLRALETSQALFAFSKMFDEAPYGKQSYAFSALSAAALANPTPTFRVAAMDTTLHSRIQPMAGVSFTSALPTLNPRMVALRAQGYGGFDRRALIDQIGVSKSALDMNRKFVEAAFALTDRRYFDPLADLVPIDLPFSEENAGIWTPADIWRDFQDFVDRLLRETADLSEPTIVDLLAKYLYASAVVSAVGARKALAYVTWVAASLSLVVLAAGALIEDPSLLTIYCLYLSLCPMDEPKP